MTPFGIRNKARKAVVAGLRSLAEVLREEELVSSAPAVAEAEPVAVSAPTVAAAPEPEREPDVDLLMAGSSMLSGMSLELPVSESAEHPEQAEPLAAASPVASGEGPLVTREEVIDTLHTIFDPEIPVDIFELGLIYEVDLRADTSVGITMTLTSPNCPAAQSMPDEVKWKVSGMEGVSKAEVQVVFDPPWTPELMSEEARLALNV